MKFFSRTLLDSSKMRKPTFGTSNPKKLMSNSMYVFMVSCPLLAIVRLNDTWESAFSPVGVSIFGSRCSLKCDWWINETSLSKSNNDGIWTPLLEMLTLGHFAEACCMILIFAWAEIPWLDSDHRTFSMSVISFEPLSAAPLPWSLDKGVSSLLTLRCVYYEQYYLGLTSFAPVQADNSVLCSSLSGGR